MFAQEVEWQSGPTQKLALIDQSKSRGHKWDDTSLTTETEHGIGWNGGGFKPINRNFVKLLRLATDFNRIIY